MSPHLEELLFYADRVLVELVDLLYELVGLHLFDLTERFQEVLTDRTNQTAINYVQLLLHRFLLLLDLEVLLPHGLALNHIVAVGSILLNCALQLGEWIEVVDTVLVFVLPLILLRVHTLRIIHCTLILWILFGGAKELLEADRRHSHEQVIHVRQTHQQIVVVYLREDLCLALLLPKEQILEYDTVAAIKVVYHVDDLLVLGPVKERHGCTDGIIGRQYKLEAEQLVCSRLRNRNL